MAQGVKNPLAVQETQETWVQFLGWEDPLKKEMAAHSSILAWEIPRTEEPGRLQSIGLQRSWTQLSNSTTTTENPCIEGQSLSHRPPGKPLGQGF